MKIFNGPVTSGQRRLFRMEKKAAKSVDVYLYDVIGDSWDGTTARQFATDLKALGEIDIINIFINSPGGSVFDGVAIYNTLIRHRAQKIVHIDGLAGSIASVVAMCGSVINIAKNGMMMIHNPWAFAMGESKDLRKQADVLDQIRTTLLATYVDRSSTSEEEISNWMNAETWFNAEEAVAAGLADNVCDKEMQMAALVTFDLQNFKNVPVTLKAAIAKAKEAAPAEPTESGPENSGEGQAGVKPNPLVSQVRLRTERMRHERAKP